MKKLLCLILALVVAMTMFACGRGQETPDTTEDPAAEEGYKIGIITGTVSQGEEEYQAAQEALATYGPEKIVTTTYPDNFSTETEATIAQVVGLASDPLVKAIVFVQAVPGASAAIDKVRETRPDMLFIAGVPGEDPAVIASKADIVLQPDEIAEGREMVLQAEKQGAKTFVHISFARHLSYATIAARRDGLMATCEELGIEYVEATAPDPTGDAGVPGAQQWIIENVPKYVAEYGKDTAFFSTNCSMQEPLIRAVAEEGAIYPQPCCPSPFHGFPAALGIEVTGHEGDCDYMLEQITQKVAEYGNTGRMSTWPVQVNKTMIEAGVAYAIEYCEGRTNGKVDDEVFLKCLTDAADGNAPTVSKYNDAATGELSNYWMLLWPYYTF